MLPMGRAHPEDDCIAGGAAPMANETIELFLETSYDQIADQAKFTNSR